MGKCYYCKKETDKQEKFYGYNGVEKNTQILYCCSEEHKLAINKELEYSNKYGKTFMILVCFLSGVITITTPVAFLMSNIVVGLLVGFLPFVLLGIVIYIFPFSTPQTTKKNGLGKAIKHTKKMGIFIQILSILLAMITYIVYILVS